MEDIQNLMYCCVIIHNMMVEERKQHFFVDQYGARAQESEDEKEEEEKEETKQADISLFGFSRITEENSSDGVVREALAARVATLSAKMEDEREHRNLQYDLVEHIWAKHNRGAHHRHYSI